MSPSRIGIRTGQAITLVVAGLGALVASLCLAMLVTMCCTSAIGASAGLVFIPVAVASFVAAAVVLKRRGWTGRVALGVLLVAGILLMMPRPMCAAESQTHMPC